MIPLDLNKYIILRHPSGYAHHIWVYEWNKLSEMRLTEFGEPSSDLTKTKYIFVKGGGLLPATAGSWLLRVIDGSIISEYAKESIVNDEVIEWLEEHLTPHEEFLEILKILHA